MTSLVTKAADLLLNMGFMSVCQLGRAGRGNEGWGRQLRDKEKYRKIGAINIEAIAALHQEKT